MGSALELNDTLLLGESQGFPVDVFDLARHRISPVTLADVEDRLFSFSGKDGARIYHLDPVRVFLVQNLGGKWLFWGKALIQSQTMEKKLNSDGSWTPGEWTMSGTYRISEVYEPAYQELFTRRESAPGKSWFD